MINLLAAIPEQLMDVWYLYDLALLAVIGVCVPVLILLRKRSNLKEAVKSVRAAKNTLKRAKTVSPHRRRFLLFSAKNVLNSAEYYYSLCVSEEDKYELVAVADDIKLAIQQLNDLTKSAAQLPQTQLDADIDKVMEYLH